ncbi:hypothetical protein V5O48_006828, partial [Marasmius crinis-equi]
MSYLRANTYKRIPDGSGDEVLPFVSLTDPDDEYLEPDTPPRTSSHPTFITIATVICALSACLSISAFFVDSSHRSTANLSLYDLQSKDYNAWLQDVRRPSQFMGLEKINRTSGRQLSIINLPFTVGRIDQLQPLNVITAGPDSRMFRDGQELRRVEVTNDISTVVQFRVIDWKLEDCALHLQLPSSLSASEHVVDVVDVFRLTSDRELDLNRLSFAHRPSQIGGKLGSARPGSSNEWTYSFPCPMDSIQTFLLAAGTSETNVSWWQDSNLDHA